MGTATWCALCHLAATGGRVTPANAVHKPIIHRAEEFIEAVLAGCAEQFTLALVEGASEDRFSESRLFWRWVRFIGGLADHSEIMPYLPS